MIKFFNLDPRIKYHLWKQKPLIIKGVFYGGLFSVITALFGLYIEVVVKAIKDKDLEQLKWLSLGVIGIYVIKYFITRAQFYYLNLADVELTTDLRKHIFNKLQRLPINHFNEKRSGDIQSVFTNDVNVYQNAIHMINTMIEGPIRVIMGFVTIIKIQPTLSLVTVSAIPFMAWAIQLNGKKIKIAQTNVQSSLAELTAGTQESILGIRVIKAFNIHSYISQRFQQNLSHYKKNQLESINLLSVLKPSVDLIGATAIAIAIYLCGYLVCKNQLSIEGVTGFMFGLNVINQGAKMIGEINQNLSQIHSATDRIYSQILDVPLLDEESVSLILPSSSGLGKIEFCDVSFIYPDGTPALSHVSFVIEPGKTAALVGPSGAGKSTIIDLILGFYRPTSGKILYDDVDITSINRDWYASQLATVPQQTFLFAGTLRDNIVFGEKYTDKEIQQALEVANAQFVQNLPQKTQTIIGERGTKLSGGEAQRIAITRAVIKSPNFLILDEATSNLDAQNEKLVQEALEQAMQRTTCLLIVHRLSMAARTDSIIVLNKGCIVEQGTHNQLSVSNGLYAKMVSSYTLNTNLSS